jgi:hypothetical protein
MFEIGERVIMQASKGTYLYVPNGAEGVVIGVHADCGGYCTVKFPTDGSCNVYNVDLKKVSNKKSMSIKEKFIISLLPEPEKSFRKAGITNSDGLITADGQTLLMTWLLNKNKKEFNEEVVQPLLKEEEVK